ncbi:hypothetical protein F2Q70_00032735 [Brassica cretica]|uniref:Uncharacterized protein n=1 Tax=Brassica cretica TaxID=69181 RepID=A0A8S9FH34_BRACR|nr:hypothetical protein F2Q70_00032735 [Brassica cretica]
MSLAISSPILPPPPVPPDLLFLQPFSDLKPVPTSRDLLLSPSPSEISVLPLLEQFAVDVSAVQAASDQSSKSKALIVDEGLSSTADTLDDVQARRLVRSRSLPIHHGLRAEKCSSLVWVEVASRSKPKPKEPPSQSRSSVPVTNSKFAEEEELIYEAQRILRARLAAVGTSNPEPSASMSRKHARRKIRQQLYLLATSDTGDGSSNSTAVSVKNKDFGLASGGQAHSRSVHSQEA